MNEFIEKMMELGAKEDKAGSKEEQQARIKEAEKLSQDHWEEIWHLSESIEIVNKSICNNMLRKLNNHEHKEK